MKKITISRLQKKSALKKFQPELFASQLLLGSGFEEGKEAHIKYAHGKLTIIMGKKPKFLE